MFKFFYLYIYCRLGFVNLCCSVGKIVCINKGIKSFEGINIYNVLILFIGSIKIIGE